MPLKSWLTVDLGNTRCKFQLWSFDRAGFPVASGATDLATQAIAGVAADGEASPGSVTAEVMGLDESLRAWLGSTDHAPATPLERALLTSVASPGVTERVALLLEEVAQRCDIQPEVELENRCRVPEEVGRDRLMAAYAAHELCGGSAIVVDAGTALTVDAVRGAGENGTASFLGGAIAPGPELLADALERRAARLPDVRLEPGMDPLGTDTVSAIQSGCGVGFRGAARELVQAISRAAELDLAPVVVTGGARAFLLEPEPFSDRDLRVVPELVHLGLLRTAGIPIPRSSR